MMLVCCDTLIVTFAETLQRIWKRANWKRITCRNTTTNLEKSELEAHHSAEFILPSALVTASYGENSFLSQFGVVMAERGPRILEIHDDRQLTGRDIPRLNTLEFPPALPGLPNPGMAGFGNPYRAVEQRHRVFPPSAVISFHGGEL